MADTDPLITLDDLKQVLEVGATTDFDIRLTDLVEVATAQIEQATGRLFTNQAHTEFFPSRKTFHDTLDLGGTMESGTRRVVQEQVLYVKGWPLVDAPAVDLRYDPGNRNFLENHKLIEGDDYEVDVEGNRIIVGFATGFYIKAFKLVYTAGYASAGTPSTLSGAADPILKEAARIQAAHLWTRSQIDSIGVSEDRGQGNNLSSRKLTVAGLTPEASSMVRKFRVVLTGRG